MLVADESSNVKVVLWDTNQIALIEEGKIGAGNVVEISNGNVRNGELHLSSFSSIKQSKEKIGEVITKKLFRFAKLKDAKLGNNVKTRALIVNMHDPRYFEVCSECGKKVNEAECAVHGKVSPKKRALLSIVLDDGSDTMRAILFAEQILQLGVSDEELYAPEKFIEVKSKLLGEEKYFAGIIRNNSIYNNIEFNVESVEEVKLDALIKELESSVYSQ